MRKLKTITVENNNYHIFKVEQQEGVLEIYFIWGKTDFRSVWERSSSVLIRQNLQIFKKSKWYNYQKISHYGVSLEETYWTTTVDDLFIDLPKNFSQISDIIFKEIISSYSIK